MEWLEIGDGQARAGLGELPCQPAADRAAALDRDVKAGERLARQMRFKAKKGGDAAEWPEEWRVRQFPLPVIDS